MKKLILTVMLLVVCLFLTSCTEAKGDEKGHREKDEKQTYEYSEYFNEEDIKKEILDMFEKYNIEYYKSSYMNKFDDIALLMPETVVVGFPKYEKMETSYEYSFDSEEELRVYLTAYIIYLMNQDYEVKDISDNIYSINDKYYIGMYKDENEYCFLIMEA